MATGSTPPKALKEKRTYPKSPATCTPTRLPKKLAKGSGIDPEEDAEGISLRDILVSINDLKVEMRDNRRIIERMSSLEERISEKFNHLVEDVKSQVKEELNKDKEHMEAEINASFQILEDDLRSKFTTMDKTQHDLNSLEQYTRKNSIRLFGIKETDDTTNIEEQALKIIKDHLEIDLRSDDVEIAHRAGKFRPEGRHEAKKARPVLLKLASHKTKVRIIKAKRKFRGTNFWIAEDLKSQNAEKVKRLNELRKAGKIKSVWAMDGKIRVKKLNDTIVLINSDEEIQHLAR